MSHLEPDETETDEGGRASRPVLMVDKPDETGRWPELTPAQELAVFLHAGGMSFADVARRLDVRRQTVSEWFQDEAVKDALDALRLEARAEIRQVFIAAGREAVLACLLALQMAVKDLTSLDYRVRHSAGRLIDRLSRTVLGHGEHPAKLELTGQVDTTPRGVVEGIDAALERLRVSLPGVLAVAFSGPEAPSVGGEPQDTGADEGGDGG